jgi:eukaryotic-like serine/threonine-protein kinase
MSSEGPHPDTGASGSLPKIDTPSMVGHILDGRYKVISKLGEGGMGEVYAAEHVHIDKRVAIKLLRSEIVANEEAVRRFQQEARSASSLKNRNIIGIEDFGRLPDGRIYMCMELLDGKALNDMIAEPIAADRLLNILIQTGHGLAAAHSKNIVHRDMKPENIFVTFEGDQDVPKLLDFGIAKVSQQEGNNHLTKTGTIFGTPFYMAPEQALGQGIDQRADIYAMGVIMYEAFCGVVPFQGESFMGILTQHITAEPRPPSQMAAMHGRVLPPGVEEIILKAMKKNPEERYHTMTDMVQALVGVYRTVAGAGMSTYMAAAPMPGPSAMYQVPHATPQGSMPAMTPPGYHAPTPFPAHQMPHSASAGSSMIEMPKRSGAGTFIIIFAVLAVLGGGFAALMIFKGGGDDDKQEVADNGNGENPPPKDPDPVPAATVDAGPAIKDPDPVPKDPDPVPNATMDAGPAVDPIPVPEVKTVSVIINSSPPGAVGYQDGLKIDKAPFSIDVTVGKPVEIVLKRDGYKDAKLVIDGQLKKVTGTLERKGGKKPPKDPKDPNKLEPGVLGGDE